MDLSKLKEPFPAKDIEWRLQQCGEGKNGVWGKCLAYVTNRAIQNRLDDVCGPENWKNEFVKGPDGGILCGISIKCDGEWVTKWDGSENTDIEAVKGGLSGAMKRAAVQFGVGRYLYDLDEGWAVISDNGKYTGKTKTGKFFKWDPPKLPKWALPKGGSPEGARVVNAEPVIDFTEEDLINAKVNLEQFINNGVLDDDPKSKSSALGLLNPENRNYDRIIACINYCKSRRA